jgi:hypothetical protein
VATFRATYSGRYGTERTVLVEAPDHYRARVYAECYRRPSEYVLSIRRGSGFSFPEWTLAVLVAVVIVICFGIGLVGCSVI